MNNKKLHTLLNLWCCHICNWSKFQDILADIARHLQKFVMSLIVCVLLVDDSMSEVIGINLNLKVLRNVSKYDKLYTYMQLDFTGTLDRFSGCLLWNWACLQLVMNANCHIVIIIRLWIRPSSAVMITILRWRLSITSTKTVILSSKYWFWLIFEFVGNFMTRSYPINKKWPCTNVLRPVTGMAKILDRNEIVTDLILLGRIIIFLD